MLGQSNGVAVHNFAPMRDSTGVSGHPAHALVRSRAFARLAANPRLERLARVLLDEPEVMRLPRQIVRHYHCGPLSSRAHTPTAPATSARSVTT